MGHRRGWTAFRHPDYDVKYCDACGLYFKNRVLSEQALADYYRLLPFESFESSELFPTDRLILSSIEPGHPDAKILDFGCGVGRILERLTVLHRCYGVEVNERAGGIARAKGITILPESAVYRRTECNFDFVILSDVFEHLAKPLQLLRILTDILKPGGALIISTATVTRYGVASTSAISGIFARRAICRCSAQSTYNGVLTS